MSLSPMLEGNLKPDAHPPPDDYSTKKFRFRVDEAMNSTSFGHANPQPGSLSSKECILQQPVIGQKHSLDRPMLEESKDEMEEDYVGSRVNF
ncbi:hypothetical protein JCGZ_18193 [Jatropha curcas]|uniref:Uncharacterized protein n=1 Tax=Jatropha curcas TaxID=180498 RepID=A0A067KD49_JATCU|nr:hypothetical protein JCGZ_18193 [Jatropha curcas]